MGRRREVMVSSVGSREKYIIGYVERGEKSLVLVREWKVDFRFDFSSEMKASFLENCC